MSHAENMQNVMFPLFPSFLLFPMFPTFIVLASQTMGNIYFETFQLKSPMNEYSVNFPKSR